MDIEQIGPESLFRRTAEQISQLKELPSIDSPKLIEEINTRGSSLSAEVLVYILRQAIRPPFQNEQLANACALALLAISGKFSIDVIVRRAGWTYGLHSSEQQAELLDECGGRMWKAIVGDRQKQYLWEVRFGRALRLLALNVAQEIRRRIEREARALKGYPEWDEMDPDSLTGEQVRGGRPVDDEVDVSRLHEFVRRTFGLLADPHATAARMCLLEQRPRKDAALALGVGIRQIGNYLDEVIDTLCANPTITRYLYDLGWLDEEPDKDEDRSMTEDLETPREE